MPGTQQAGPGQAVPVVVEQSLRAAFCCSDGAGKVKCSAKVAAANNEARITKEMDRVAERKARFFA